MRRLLLANLIVSQHSEETERIVNLTTRIPRVSHIFLKPRRRLNHKVNSVPSLRPSFKPMQTPDFLLAPSLGFPLDWPRAFLQNKACIMTPHKSTRCNAISRAGADHHQRSDQRELSVPGTSSTIQSILCRASIR